jgi:hypothetical protein
MIEVRFALHPEVSAQADELEDLARGARGSMFRNFPVWEEKGARVRVAPSYPGDPPAWVMRFETREDWEAFFLALSKHGKYVTRATVESR